MPVSFSYKFWQWYERHYKTNLKLTAILFSWQVVHLIWLAAVVVVPELFSRPRPDLPHWFNLLLAFVDYTEIPALLGISLIYIHELRKKFGWKNFLLLLFLNSQWLHLFWITDEFVINAFTNQFYVNLPLWLAWLAILIDYLELPVMFDTFKKYLNLNKH